MAIPRITCLTIPSHQGTDLTLVSSVFLSPVPEEPTSPFCLIWVPILPEYRRSFYCRSQENLTHHSLHLNIVAISTAGLRSICLIISVSSSASPRRTCLTHSASPGYPSHLGTVVFPAPVPEEPVSTNPPHLGTHLTWVLLCFQRQSQKNLSPPIRLTWVPISPGYRFRFQR